MTKSLIHAVGLSSHPAHTVPFHRAPAARCELALRASCGFILERFSLTPRFLVLFLRLGTAERPGTFVALVGPETRSLCSHLQSTRMNAHLVHSLQHQWRTRVQLGLFWSHFCHLIKLMKSIHNCRNGISSVQINTANQPSPAGHHTAGSTCLATAVALGFTHCCVVFYRG